MWLKVGIPVLVLLGVVAVRLVYYFYWRRHWDGRRGRVRRAEPTEVVVIRETESHLGSAREESACADRTHPNDGPA
jgi:hypothetical protein